MKIDRSGTITVAAFLIILVFLVLAFVFYLYMGLKPIVAALVLIFVCLYVKALRNPMWPFSEGFIEERRRG